MYSLTPEEIRSFRILCLIPLVLGLAAMFYGPESVPLRNFIASGDQQLSIELDKALISVSEISQRGSISPDRVIINEASFDELNACPGISSKTASLILQERKFAPFFDWRDFDDRVKHMGPAKIQTLKEAGVRLKRDEK